MTEPIGSRWGIVTRPSEPEGAPMNEPTTAAGRKMLADQGTAKRREVLAIEVEAHAAGLRETQAAGDELREAAQAMLDKFAAGDVWDGTAQPEEVRLIKALAAAPVQPAAAPRETADLPDRIVVGANGAYWRDYGTFYSMPPASTDNEPIDVIAVYERLAPAAASAELADMLVEDGPRDVQLVREWDATLPELAGAEE